MPILRNTSGHPTFSAIRTPASKDISHSCTIWPLAWVSRWRRCGCVVWRRWSCRVGPLRPWRNDNEGTAESNLRKGDGSDEVTDGVAAICDLLNGKIFGRSHCLTRLARYLLRVQSSRSESHRRAPGPAYHMQDTTLPTKESPRDCLAYFSNLASSRIQY